MASRIFSYLSPSSTVVLVALGKYKHYGDWMERQEDIACSAQLCFQRREPVIEGASAMWLDFCEVKYVEVESDLLRFPLCNP